MAFTAPHVPHIFVFGLGYSAHALARHLRQSGTLISATCRTREKQRRLRDAGIDAHIFDRSNALDTDGRRALEQATHLLSSVPPDEDGDPVIDLHGGDIRNAAPFDWIGYLSTTGVYGNRDGATVDETADLTPSGSRGRRRLLAEQAWFSLGEAGPVQTFRLAGIYGPGRNALETVRSGRAKRVVKPGQVFSRIHVDDIRQILLASMAKPENGAAYNCCDDDPAPPQEVIAYACELMGVEPPPEIPFEEAELSPMARSFYADNKRVSNDRIKRELGVDLLWPSYRSALKTLHDLSDRAS
ncbi:SDR family oxidoreductase [Rhodospirillaceae bacterium KN72]|uniref:SDR family oxidoreductase n=1 Tax=Pacificispira spongiicola TaxID=2729598 RepID=A0A7Y0E0A5_9PROT|nr:SDR family oxidoreductase [Pacificispira spongiicola]NMM44864.1 SDR family oxidoreductase [Pacificispira spongiicola]